MKAGDIVKKISGDWDVGKVGYVLKVESNGIGTTIVTVVVGTDIKSWSSNLVAVISEAR